ncbi:hypothetical protein FT663_01077 [Candidozyma haemuli var. vulneris]|uniref:Vacuolar protein sorting-associated protein 55 n=1 Tax=Candidozyma haemuli TaxID=45357 RepID=A0A2V1AUK9_9ASCO|nr:hypothetical protein CXQ85_000452 [[Candida] haemuloni]KAF3986103.1 hypothetical protein FT662_04760 [[Candida] haemuloni var. vulneris]KAF3994847.1 hypothetical protein FT663_01077 [[Candida] haemuloni var. vulneris]PVH21472.1 hypothetical protein CXQ85_000452 [[Candida] haemuloni]
MNSTTEFRNNPLNKIVGLSVVLSMGFLLVILAGIYGNWFPIINGLIFAVAYLPAVITRAAFDKSDYDFNFDPQTSSHTSAVQEAGKFLTGFLVLTGFSLPILLHHSLILTKTASVLTIIGGGLIFGTVYTFSQAFDQPEEENDDLGGGVI